MKILVTGSTGLIGSALVSFLAENGHVVKRLVRTEPASGEDEIHWSPDSGSIDKSGLEELDAVVHLAGENLASGKWTAEKKARIRDSRVEGTPLAQRINLPAYTTAQSIGVLVSYRLLRRSR